MPSIFDAMTMLKKAVLLLVLAVFVTGIGAPGFNSKSLAHELDHERHESGMLAGHYHHYDADGLPANSDHASEPLSDAEHHLLHSACHFPPLLVSSLFDRIGASPVRDAPILSQMLLPPTVEPKPLFRPPRITNRT